MNTNGWPILVPTNGANFWRTHLIYGWIYSNFVWDMLTYSSEFISKLSNLSYIPWFTADTTDIFDPQQWAVTWNKAMEFPGPAEGQDLSACRLKASSLLLGRPGHFGWRSDEVGSPTKSCLAGVRHGSVRTLKKKKRTTHNWNNYQSTTSRLGTDQLGTVPVAGRTADPDPTATWGFDDDKNGNWCGHPKKRWGSHPKKGRVRSCHGFPEKKKEHTQFTDMTFWGYAVVLGQTNIKLFVIYLIIHRYDEFHTQPNPIKTYWIFTKSPWNPYQIPVKSSKISMTSWKSPWKSHGNWFNPSQITFESSP